MVYSYPMSYKCDCGCNLSFENFSLGIEYHICDYTDEQGSGRMIYETKIIGYSWSDYIDDLDNKTIGEFIQLIKQNKDIDNVWKHLYNQYIDMENIPQNKKLRIDYCF